MLAHCLKKYRDTHRIIVTFANTGCEHEATLKFVDQCDRYIAKGQVVWIEAVIDPRPGKGITHKIVDYFTASRKGEPFRAAIEKYGIPNRTTPYCTARLKTEAMEHYLKSVGWKKGKKMNYVTAIGIRADEMDRVSPNAEKHGWIYPLVKGGITKDIVKTWWKRQPFDLEIPADHYGNCMWCWKKSLRKLMTLARESVEVFDFPLEMERTYGKHKVFDCAAAHNGRRAFFEKHRTAKSIILDAWARDFKLYRDDTVAGVDFTFDPDIDVGSSCGETCEIGADI